MATSQKINLQERVEKFCDDSQAVLLSKEDEDWDIYKKELLILLQSVRDEALELSLEIYEKAFENNWNVQNTIDHIRSLKSQGMKE